MLRGKNEQLCDKKTSEFFKEEEQAGCRILFCHVLLFAWQRDICKRLPAVTFDIRLNARVAVAADAAERGGTVPLLPVQPWAMPGPASAAACARISEGKWI